MSKHDPFADFKLEGHTFVEPHIQERQIAEAYTKHVIAKRDAEFTERMDSVSRDLAGTSNAKPMPLSVFEHIFYPLFADENMPDTEKAARLNAWRTHAGGSYAEVPVVDDKNPAKVYFYVPGLTNSDILNERALELSKQGVPSLGKMENQLSALRSVGRHAEAAQIEEQQYEMRVPSKEMADKAAILNALRWNDIARALGKPPIYPKLAAACARIEAPNNPGADTVAAEMPDTTTPKSNSVFDELF